MKKYLTFLILFFSLASWSQEILNSFDCMHISDCLKYCALKANEIDQNPQQIKMLVIPRSPNDDCFIDIAFDEKKLIKTSKFCKKNGALAAINGGFFNMKDGGAVHYLEYKNKLVNPGHDFTKNSLKDSTFNAVLIHDSISGLRIEKAESTATYIQSQHESFVLKTGPLLIKNGIEGDLPASSFVLKRHPRTCIGIDETSIYFITIDGRKKKAAGMNLIELQHFLSELGINDAINLDGGGSTSMFLLDSLVNQPSDLNGERKVANAILIKNK